MNRVVFWIFAAPLALLVLGVIAIGLMVEKAKRDLKKSQSDLAQNGEVLTWEKFLPPSSDRRSPRKPDLVAAGEEFAQIIETNHIPIVRTPEWSARVARSHGLENVSIWSHLPKLHSSSRQISWETAAAEFERVEPQIEVLRDTSSHPFQLSWDTSSVSETIRSLKFVSLGLTADTLLRMREGDFPSAVADIEASVGISRILGEQPFLSFLRLKLIFLSGADTCTWQMLQTRRADSETLARLQKAWDETDALSSVLFALRTERAWVLKYPVESFYQAVGLNPPGLGKPVSTEGEIGLFIWSNFLRYRDERLFADRIQKLVESAKAAEVDGNWGSYFAEAAMVRDASTEQITLLLNAYMVPEFAYVAERSVQTQVRVGLTRCAIALSRYEMDHSGYPQSLAELVPHYLAAIPLDLFDGKPLRYRRVTANEFVLYSVGKNLIDDGGDSAPLPGSGYKESKDFVWEKPAPIEAPKSPQPHSQSR